MVNPPVGLSPFNGHPLDALQCRCNDGGGGGGGEGSSIWVVRSRVKSPQRTDQRYLSGSGFFIRPRFVAAGSRYNAILFRVKFNTSVTTHTNQPALVCAVILFPPSPRSSESLFPVAATAADVVVPRLPSRWPLRAGTIPYPSSSRCAPLLYSCTHYARYIAPCRRIMSHVFLNRSERVLVAVTYFFPPPLERCRSDRQTRFASRSDVHDNNNSTRDDHDVTIGFSVIIVVHF